MKPKSPPIKRLIILRHGPHQDGGFLTSDGGRRVEILSDELCKKKPIEPETTIVLYSREPRMIKTLKTAQAFMLRLGLEKFLHERCCPELFSDDRVCEIKPALQILMAASLVYETVLVITHEEMMQKLPDAFLAWVEMPLVGERRLDFLHGYDIDVEAKTVTRI